MFIFLSLVSDQSSRWNRFSEYHSLATHVAFPSKTILLFFGPMFTGSKFTCFYTGFFGYTRYFNGPILFFYRVPKNILHKSRELIYEKGYFREKNVLKCCFQLKYLISLLDIDVIDLDRILEHCKIVVFFKYL
jgi:hypothetical protein